ncbi:helix-turn-helix domain-containing protein [Paeniglutamicibacter antarcticus]|uniref:HTH cro/C1-type domain-containing protein n=1 Tax=Paeniglutamicibacter antarcticus TaxID=494023 RepID=A0ABP9TMU6_9MICC
MGPVDTDVPTEIQRHPGQLRTDRTKILVDPSGLVDIGVANLSVLKNNCAKAIRFCALRAMCHAMDCEVGDLPSYVPAR